MPIRIFLNQRWVDAHPYQKFCYNDFLTQKENEVDYHSNDINFEQRFIIPESNYTIGVKVPKVIIPNSDLVKNNQETNNQETINQVFLTMLRINGKIYYRNNRKQIIEIEDRQIRYEPQNENKCEAKSEAKSAIINIPKIDDNWFKNIFGYDEKDVRTYMHMTTNNNIIIFSIGGKKLQAGEFVLEKYNSLVYGISQSQSQAQNLTFKIIPNSVTELIWKDTEKSVFQVASQFNCLEMKDQYTTPEQGITMYHSDNTQGPKCAIMCGAGTYYRNYLYNRGQTKDKQINTIEESITSIGFRSSGNVLIKDNNTQFKYENGYLLGDIKSHEEVGNILKKDTNLKNFRSNFNIGVHYDTQVWDTNRVVHQIFASALPLSYSGIGIDDVKPGSGLEKFVQEELNLVYESTILAAEKCRKRDNSQRKKVYLTLVGGGAFKNPRKNIILAIQNALNKYKHLPLDIILVDYKNPSPVSLQDFGFNTKYLKYKSKYLKLKKALIFKYI